MPSAPRLILWVFLFCLVASGFSLVFVDQALSQYFSDSGLEQFWLLNREITNIGLASHYFLISAILFIFLYLWGRYLPNHPAWRKPLQTWSGIFFVCLITSGAVVMAVKFIFGRLRPHKTTPEFNPFIFEPFNFHWDYQSFPSGHTQVIFCVATMLALLFPRLIYVIALFAVSLSFTRVVTHSHFLSDCIMGAFIGWSVTLLTYRAISEWLKKSSLLKNQG